MLRKMLALVCCGALVALPAWSSSDPVGQVAAAQGAKISGTEALPGTTLFSGERITVPAHGLATLYLSGGSVLQMSGGTAVRLAREGGRIEVQVDWGGIRLSSSGRESSAVRVADMRFSPASPNSASVALVKLAGGSRVDLFAERGDWDAYTAANGRTVVLRHGDVLRGVVSPGAPQSTVGAQENKRKRRKLGVIWIGTAVVGTATGLGMAFGMSECNVASGPCPPPSPVASPVAP